MRTNIRHPTGDLDTRLFFRDRTQSRRRRAPHDRKAYARNSGANPRIDVPQEPHCAVFIGIPVHGAYENQMSRVRWFDRGAKEVGVYTSGNRGGLRNPELPLHGLAVIVRNSDYVVE